jgi:hypothetical protein
MRQLLVQVGDDQGTGSAGRPPRHPAVADALGLSSAPPEEVVAEGE